jgi:hypothetical protein
VNNFLAVQVVQTYKDHCKVIHCFIFTKNLLFFHQGFKISPICKLCNDTDLYQSLYSLVINLILVFDNERMISFLQYLEFSFVTQFVPSVEMHFWNVDELCCIPFLGVLFLNFVNICKISASDSVLWNKVYIVCVCSCF